MISFQQLTLTRSVQVAALGPSRVLFVLLQKRYQKVQQQEQHQIVLIWQHVPEESPVPNENSDPWSRHQRAVQLPCLQPRMKIAKYRCIKENILQHSSKQHQK